MSAEVIVPMVSALLGAIIGSAGSVLVVLIQAWKDERKHMRETAIQMALSERSEQMQFLREQGGALSPV